MHFHLPKPLHGWREFAGEIGVIVVGVLIALSAEQIVETIHWRHEVDAGREALKIELQRVASQSNEREAISGCLGRRLQEIATIVDRAGESDRLPPVGPIGGPPRRLWHLQSWDDLKASQTATHFSRTEMLQLGNIDAYLRTIEQLNTNEMGDWTSLWTIVGPGRRLAGSEEVALRQAVSRADYDAKQMRVAAHQLLEHIRDDHLLSNSELADVTADQRADLRRLLQESDACRPIGPPAAHYGGSPLKLDLLAPFPSN